MHIHRLATLVLAVVFCALLVPLSAFATKDSDKSMTSSTLSEAGKQLDAFEDVAKAWKKAAPGSPEAETLAKKGAAALAALEDYCAAQLKVFEERRQWYAAQGGDYREGRDFMEIRAERLQKLLDNAKKLDLYKHLKP